MNKIVQNKINKDVFLERVTDRLNRETPDGEKDRELFTVEEVFKACLDELVESICAGYRIAFTGFGSFFAHVHKGHPVQFGGKKNVVCDYRVVKFVSSNVLNKKVRESTPNVDAE